MEKLFGLILVLSFCFFQTTVSHGAPYWAKTFGGSDGEPVNSIQETTDGGYVAAGGTLSFGAGGFDGWIVKLDNSGNTIWQKTYGESGGDVVYSIQETTDGGYVAAGSTSSFGAGASDAWIIKLDSAGNVTWQKTYGGGDLDSMNFILETTDGGYVVAASTYSFGAGGTDAWVIKLDSAGNVTWQKTYGGGNQDYISSIQETTDGGYVTAGWTASYGAGGTDAWIIKLDSAGNVTWQKTYGGSAGDRIDSIQETTDGGYVAAGSTSSFGAWIIMLDSSGNPTWQKTYGGGAILSIQQTTDGGYVAAGQTYSFGAGIRDGWIVKLDSAGNVTWQNTYGGSDEELIASIQETTDGGYIAVGGTKSFGAGDFDAFLLRLDNNGAIPNCDIVGTSNAIITDATVIGQDINVTISNTSATIDDTTISPAESSASIPTVCEGDPTDLDNDGIHNLEDNCPEIPNGPDGGTCTEGTIGEACMSNGECGDGGVCSTNQEDTFPPEGNNIGDACDCESDFNCDGNVDANDVTAFLGDFGRSTFNNPCTNASPCNGDVNCDVNVDAIDVNKFLEDFGRSQFNNPCPACEVGDWCVY